MFNSVNCPLGRQQVLQVQEEAHHHYSNSERFVIVCVQYVHCCVWLSVTLCVYVCVCDRNTSVYWTRVEFLNKKDLK